MSAQDRFDKISSGTLVSVTMQTYALLHAACRRDSDAVAAEIAGITAFNGMPADHDSDPDKRLVLAMCQAMALCEQTDTDQYRGKTGRPEFARLMPRFHDVILFSKDAYGARKAAAYGFMDAYLSEDYELQFAITDQYGEPLLHGLAELITATCTSENHTH